MRSHRGKWLGRYQRTLAFAPPGPGATPGSPEIFSPGTVAAEGVVDSEATSVFEAQPLIAKTKTSNHNQRRPEAFMANESVIATKLDSRPPFFKDFVLSIDAGRPALILIAPRGQIRSMSPGKERRSPDRPRSGSCRRDRRSLNTNFRVSALALQRHSAQKDESAIRQNHLLGV
jgi:hypothetical protein